MIRVAARYHRLPIAVLVGLTSGVLVVAAGMMLKPVLVAPVASPAVVVPSPVGPPPTFAVIVPFTTPSLAAPSLPAVSPPGRSADSPPPPVATAQPTATVAVSAPPTVAPTLEPTVAPTLPPVTPAPTQPPVVTPAPTVAPTPLPAVAVSCANGVDNGGGTGTICDATIFAGFVTVLECHGAAGDPRAACSTRTLEGRVTSVDMCNGTANGGGATLRCSVTGVGAGSAPVTLCVGSGAGGTLVGMTCTESGSSVPVNLCNGSGNGGGALLICAVLS